MAVVCTDFSSLAVLMKEKVIQLVTGQSHCISLNACLLILYLAKETTSFSSFYILLCTHTHPHPYIHPYTHLHPHTQVAGGSDQRDWTGPARKWYKKRGEINEGRDVPNKGPERERERGRGREREMQQAVRRGPRDVSHSISPGLSYLSYLRPHISPCNR